MEDDVTVLLGAIAGNQFHESVPSIKSDEDVIDPSVFEVTPEPSEGGVPGASDVCLREPMFERMGMDCKEFHKGALSFCIQFRIQKIKLMRID